MKLSLQGNWSPEKASNWPLVTGKLVTEPESPGLGAPCVSESHLSVSGFFPFLSHCTLPQSLYVATSCQLRRMESASYSSVCSHVAETFQGSAVVRAFQAQGHFVAQSDALMDANQRVSFPRLVADR